MTFYFSKFFFSIFIKSTIEGLVNLKKKLNNFSHLVEQPKLRLAAVYGKRSVFVSAPFIKINHV